MIISHKHRFIFIKTTKTAGTSIEIALSRYCGAHDMITAVEKEDEKLRQEYQGKGPQNDRLPLHCFKKRDWNTLRRCRLPRIRSHTSAADARKIVGEEVWRSYFKFSVERNPYDKAVSRYFWGIKHKEEKPGISDFLEMIPETKISNWGLYTINDRIAVDFVMRYEDLVSDLELVRKRIGLPEPLVLPQSKGSYRKDRRDYRELLEPPARLRIEAICAKELREFGYRWDNKSSALHDATCETHY